MQLTVILVNMQKDAGRSPRWRRREYEEDMIERQGEVLNFEGSAFWIFV